MKFLRSLQLAVFAALLIFLVPQANAQGLDLGTIIKDSLQHNFTYTADAEIDVKKGGDMDLPFELNIAVNEEGGKNGKNYGKKGTIDLEVSDIEAGPFGPAGLSYVNAALDYKSVFQNSTRNLYIKLSDLSMLTDSSELQTEFNKVLEAAMPLWKKYIRFNMDEFIEMLANENGFSHEDRMFLEMLTDPNFEQKYIDAFAGLFNTLLESGVIAVEEGSTSSSGRNRRSSAQSILYTMSLSDRIDARGAGVLKQGLIEFFEIVAPEMVDEIRNDPSSNQEIADEISEGLQEMSRIKIRAVMGVNQNLMKELSIAIDLNGVDLPITFSEHVFFDYGQGYVMTIPTKDNSLSIQEFAALAEQIERQAFGGDGVFEEDFDLIEFDLGTTLNAEADAAFVKEFCGSDKRCKRKETRRLQNAARRLVRQGEVTRQAFRKYVRTLRRLLRR